MLPGYMAPGSGDCHHPGTRKPGLAQTRSSGYCTSKNESSTAVRCTPNCKLSSPTKNPMQLNLAMDLVGRLHRCTAHPRLVEVGGIPRDSPAAFGGYKRTRMTPRDPTAPDHMGRFGRERFRPIVRRRNLDELRR